MIESGSGSDSISQIKDYLGISESGSSSYSVLLKDNSGSGSGSNSILLNGEFIEKMDIAETIEESNSNTLIPLIIIGFILVIFCCACVFGFLDIPKLIKAFFNGIYNYIKQIVNYVRCSKRCSKRYSETLSNMIEVVIVSKPKKKASLNDDCSICIDTIKPNSEMGLECGHYFHKECILEWFKSSINNDNKVICPLCRMEVKIKTKNPIRNNYVVDSDSDSDSDSDFD